MPASHVYPASLSMLPIGNGERSVLAADDGLNVVGPARTMPSPIARRLADAWNACAGLDAEARTTQALPASPPSTDAGLNGPIAAVEVHVALTLDVRSGASAVAFALQVLAQALQSQGPAGPLIAYRVLEAPILNAIHRPAAQDTAAADSPDAP